MPNWSEFSKIAAHFRSLWLLDHPWKSLKTGYFTVFLSFIWPILVTNAPKMIKIAKKHVGIWNSCWEIIKIVTSSFFQISSIFDPKPIKCRFWTKMDQCAIDSHTHSLWLFALISKAFLVCTSICLQKQFVPI